MTNLYNGRYPDYTFSVIEPGDLNISNRSAHEDLNKLVSVIPSLQKQRPRLNSRPSATKNSFLLFPATRHVDPVFIMEKGRANLQYFQFINRVFGELLPQYTQDHDGSPVLRGDGKEPLSAFAGLRSSMAHSMDLSLPPLITQSKVSDFVGSEDEKLHNNLVSAFFSEHNVVNFRHPGGGTTSAPDWETDRSSKQEMIDDWLIHLRRNRDLINQGLWSELYHKGNTFNATFLQTRRQPENPEKMREKITWNTYATGEIEQASKFIDTPGVPPTFGASRLRLVYATSASMNWPFGSYQLYPFLHRFLEKYGATYKVKSASELTSFIGDWLPISVDVEQFDTRQPVGLLKSFFKGMERRLGTDWTWPTYACYLSPLITPPQSIGSLSGLLGAPLRGPWTVTRGLPSGHAANVPIGRINGTFLQLIALIDLGIIKSSEWEEVLLGRHRNVRLKNSSDDCAFICRNKEIYDLIRRYFKMDSHPYYNVDVDDYFTFLGNVLYRQRGITKAGLRSASFLVNLLAPESPAGSSIRSYPFTGFSARRENYLAGGVPFIRYLMEDFEALVRDEFGINWLDYVHEGLSSESLPLNSQADREYLADQAVVHYKLDIESVSPSLLNIMTLTVPSEQLTRNYPHVYR